MSALAYSGLVSMHAQEVARDHSYRRSRILSGHLQRDIEKDLRELGCAEQLDSTLIEIQRRADVLVERML